MGLKGGGGQLRKEKYRERKMAGQRRERSETGISLKSKKKHLGAKWYVESSNKGEGEKGKRWET